MAFVASRVVAFAPQQRPFVNKKASSSVRPLQGHANDWCAPVATAALGWTLVTQVAVADIDQNVDVPSTFASTTTSLVLSEAPAYEKLDFSMPSYNTGSSGGFGQGTEARLGEPGPTSLTDPGAGEKEKQEEAMKKAEQARQARLQEKKEAAKRREEEDRIRAQKKKLEREARMRGEFD